MVEKAFNPTSPLENTIESTDALKGEGVTATNYVKGEFTGLFVSSIKFPKQSALSKAPSPLQHPLPFILALGLKVRQTDVFVSSPGRP